jgi:hypothetical protein
MTQEEIKSIIDPIRKDYNEVYTKLQSIKEDDYPNTWFFERHRENLLGQTTAYQNVIASLQAIHMKIALADAKNAGL